MPAGRFTAKQALDHLHIHQQRRENEAIYQEVQALRKEVSALHKQNERTDEAASKAVEGMQSLENSRTTQSEKIRRLKSQFEEVSNDNNILRKSTERMKADLDQTAHDRRTMFTRLEEINLDSEKRSISLEESLKHDFHCLKEDFASLNCQLDTKTNNDETAALQERLRALENNIRPLQQENRSISRVDDSFEGRDDCVPKVGISAAKRPISQADLNDETLQNTSQMQHSFHDGGDLMLSIERPTETLLSSTVEGPDQCRNSREISYLDHSIRATDRGDSMTMLAPPQPDANHVVDSLLSMRQQPLEKASRYLSRCNSVFESLPEGFEEVFLTRFVGGLSDIHQREQMRRWLDTSTWSVANARDFILLCEHTTKAAPTAKALAKAQEMIVYGKAPAPKDAVKVHGPRVELNEAEHGYIEKSRSANIRLEQRRSQRLAELRSRHEGEDRGHDGMETTKQGRPQNAQPRKPDAKSSSFVNKKRPSAGLRDSKGRFKAKTRKIQAHSASRKPGAAKHNPDQERDANLPKAPTGPFQQSLPDANDARKRMSVRGSEKGHLVEDVRQTARERLPVPQLTAVKYHSNPALEEPNNPEAASLPQTPQMQNRFIDRGPAIKRKCKHSIGPPPEIPILSTTTDGI